MIDRFKGQYAFLSNFYPCTIIHGGITHPSVEHAYQAAKFLPGNEDHRRAISKLSAGEAKRYGRRAILPPRWNEQRIEIMRSLLYRKFSDPQLRKWLLQTGTNQLVEGNWWGDKFWGICNGEGENMLGKLLMEIRDNASSSNVSS